MEKLNGAEWNMILAEYTEIVFARTTTLEQKMLIVEETKKRGDNIVDVVSFKMFISRPYVLIWV